MTQLIDTHVHLHLCKESPEILVNRAKAVGISAMVNVATDLASSRHNLVLAKQFPEVFPTAGIHPSEMTDLNLISELETLIKEHRFVAIGEVGIDYYHADNPPSEIQIAGFRAQLELAQKYNLPVIIHTRSAAEDTLKIVKEFPDVTKVFHCFSESPEFIAKAASPNTYFSFTGMITYTNKSAILNSILAVDMDHIMIETDCPYLTPTSLGKVPNEPSFVIEVVKKIAQTRNLSFEEVAHRTTANAHTFFRF